jgi:hypothetical protein
MNIDKEILLNDFAIRSFRDTADLDYIAARVAYQTQLTPQSLWSALQSIEKYFKCILLLNRICVKNKDLGHDIEKAMNLIAKSVPFSLNLHESSFKYIKHLNTYGRYRYFEVPYYSEGEELVWLDKTVWQIRRYCQTLNYEVELDNGEKRNLLNLNLEKIKNSEQLRPHKFNLISGQLEKIIANKKHPARKWLIKDNFFFGTRGRKSINVPNYMQSANPPLMLSPQIIEEIFDLGYMPNQIVEAYRKEYKLNNLPI